MEVSELLAEYQSALEELNRVQEHFACLNQQLEEQSIEFHAFEKLFMKESLTDSVGKCAAALNTAGSVLQKETEDDWKKLPEMDSYLALCRKKELLCSPAAKIVNLLKKTGSPISASLYERLLQKDMEEELADYNKELVRLGRLVEKPDVFQNTLSLHKRENNVCCKMAVGEQGQCNGTDTDYSRRLKVGSVIQFGSYPQTKGENNLTPIEWMVLEVQGIKALLISKYGLDSRPYNQNFKGITWESCALRNWLNHQFIDNAFSRSEQQAIYTTMVDNSEKQGYSEWHTRGGNNTQDRLFLLSYQEANKYFNVSNIGSDNVKSRVQPTAYAKKQGASTNTSYKTYGGAEAGWWWLRSPGDYQDLAACVSREGSLSSRSVNYDCACVRPAFWFNLESSNLFSLYSKE